MGKHKEWRQIAKKMRRKRIRSAAAAKRDEEEKRRMDIISNTPYYKTWLAEQQALDLFREQEEKRASLIAHQNWEQAEALAQERWLHRQKMLVEEEAKRQAQEALIREEWEKEQEKERLEKEARENEDKRKKLQYERLMEEMDSFIEGTGVKPDALDTIWESNPGKELCQFYTKVGSCRFKDSCSRNHIRPGVSNTILIPGFYTHLSLEINGHGEYDTDINLEFDNNERNRDFREFFDDICPELEKFGPISQLRVCSNTEPHLRGNVYVAYQSERSAAAAYKALNGRYYGGRILSVEFVNLLSWKDAICGLQFRERCPKGSQCNFLHVFRNPRGKYSSYEPPSKNKKPSTPPERSWRWTPSPETEEKSERTRDHRSHWDDDLGGDDRRAKHRRSGRTSERRSRQSASERNTRRYRSRSRSSHKSKSRRQSSNCSSKRRK